MSNQKVSDLADGGAVQDTDEFYAQRGSSQVKISGDKLGGSLPAWWTVDSTPGQETVTFAGEVVIAPTADFFGALRIQLASGGTSELTQWLDENGDPLLAVRANGEIHAAAENRDPGGYLLRMADGGNNPILAIGNAGRFDINPADDAVFPLSVGSVLIVGPEDGSAPAVEVDQRPSGVGLRIIGNPTPGNLSEILDSSLTALHAVGPDGEQGWFNKAATPAAQQTGVAVTAAAIHAALVNYGLITA